MLVAETDWRQLHVLVVDDEEQVRVSMKVLLEIMGCTVYLADGTERAVALAAQDKPDIVLADFRLYGDDSGLRTIANCESCTPDCRRY